MMRTNRVQKQLAGFEIHIGRFRPKTGQYRVTTTLPLASSQRIDELPPGPGVADLIGTVFALGFPAGTSAAVF